MAGIKIEKIKEIPKTKLGEGPHWDAKNQVLYFCDIEGPSIHKFDTKTRKHTSAKLDGVVGHVIPVKATKDKFEVAVGREIAIVTWDGESSEVSNYHKIGEVDQGTKNRINDGKCDPSGRLWTGTMGPEKDSVSWTKEAGQLFSVEKDKIKLSGINKIGISNGLAWNLALKKMYYNDSLAGTVDEFDYDIETGSISNRKSVFTIQKAIPDSFPDGMTIDTDGNLWVAVYNGSSVIKIDPRKAETLLQTVKFPAKYITSCVFGGPNLDELYVVSRQDETEYGGSTYKVTGLGAKGYPGDEFIF